MSLPLRGRQARKLNGKERRKLKNKILNRDGNNCWICNLSFNEEDLPTIDHIIPLAEGGTHHLKNLKLAHRKCNETRGNPYVKLDPEIEIEHLQNILDRAKFRVIKTPNSNNK